MRLFSPAFVYRRARTGGLELTGRVYITYGVLAAAVVALGGRAAWLVLDKSHAAGEYAANQQRRVIVQPGRPGSILARAHDGYVLLAGSTQAAVCFVDPALVDEGKIADMAIRLGSVLGADPLGIQEAIVLRGGRRFAPIKRGLTAEQAGAVGKLPFRSVGITYLWRREYPCGQLGATVVGYRFGDGLPGGGIEQSQWPHLRAVDGKRAVLTDAGHRAIWLDTLRSRTPQDGNSVYLCLDTVVQGYLEQAVRQAVEQFEAKWGTGVVANPRTGEILAMYSARRAGGRVVSERGADRAIAQPYEPGSAMKPIFAAAAVDCGRMSYRTRIHCENGLYRTRGGGTIRDHHSYGTLSLADVVVHSSNIGMAKVGEALGNRRMHRIAERFGFGRATQIDLPGESRGILRPADVWDGYSKRRVPFGHEISVTTLQLTMAFCSLANGGELLRPRLVDHVRTPGGRVVWRSRRRVVRRTVSRATAAASVAVMRQVVERGTGRACRLQYWSSFGKTGTAQIPGRGGYVPDAFAGSFVGGAPASNPRVICLITTYWPKRSKGYYGSKVAAPFVKQVLHKTLVYLDVPPDKDTIADGR